MNTAAARSDWGKNAEEVPMDNELLCNKDFIRCSTLVAELLMKYKSMEIKEIETNGEPAEGSPLSCSFPIANSLVIVYNRLCR